MSDLLVHTARRLAQEPLAGCEDRQHSCQCRRKATLMPAQSHKYRLLQMQPRWVSDEGS